MTTIADVLTEIKRQLDWVGPGGQGQGHIVLSREMAQYARELVLALILERDEITAKVEQCEKVMKKLEADVAEAIKEKPPQPGGGQGGIKAELADELKQSRNYENQALGLWDKLREAEAEIERLRAELADERESPAVSHAMADFYEALTQRRVAEAVTAERERCARIAETITLYGSEPRKLCDDIAVAIRKGEP